MRTSGRRFLSCCFAFGRICPIHCNLVSNRRTFPDDRVIPVQVGDERSWSQTLMCALDHVPGRYVLLMLDLFFDRPRRYCADRQNACRDGQIEGRLFAIGAGAEA
jgi:hypothetical protein